MTRYALFLAALALLAAGCGPSPAPGSADNAGTPSVAESPGEAKAADGRYISWHEHLVDDEQTNGGTAIRGADGLVMADIDRDGHLDIISAHEDSNHLRIAFGTERPDVWANVTIGQGAEVGAIEDVAVGDINDDGWPDVMAASEEAHLVYFQNPGDGARKEPWGRLIPEITQGRGSWLRVFIADMNQNGRMDILGANKGAADIIDPAGPQTAERPTSLFLIDGDPLDQSSWREQVLATQLVPNTAMPVDIDGDGDLDVLVADRLRLEMAILEVVGFEDDGNLIVQEHPIRIVPGFAAPEDWQGVSSAFQSVFADLDGDGRQDLIVAVYETPQAVPGSPLMAGLGWLQQPASLDQPWIYFPIGDTLPDFVAGIAVADIDGDGHLDVISGGYSGLNILAGGFSGASRNEDDPRVTASSTVGRIAWFRNPGDPRLGWQRHDISRRVRGMYDAFVPLDLDGDGDVDLVATRGNSGEYDGVFWLEQLRTQQPAAAFSPARTQDSRALPLPPSDWIERYEEEVTFVAPNKLEQE
ncbi:FG-GAP repeat domain-containing protein [Kineobactrum salinum]|uniref:VCBS repeat-containing protein n=1 Tax=Kineobactrum salinum TaxID=2708301 RepID=A0A6C0U5I7_9GAMM|nr:VCBS repeat-containing protein [Kineobactrum salinum]QIB67198.1 VCBS repeat-containing protein [Kineobactrum salinum]